MYTSNENIVIILCNYREYSNEDKNSNTNNIDSCSLLNVNIDSRKVIYEEIGHKDTSDDCATEAAQCDLQNCPAYESQIIKV